METFKAVFLRRSLSFLWYLQSFSLTRRNLYQFLFISFQILLHPSNRFCTNHFVFCTNSQKVCTNLQQDFTLFSTKNSRSIGLMPVYFYPTFHASALLPAKLTPSPASLSFPALSRLPNVCLCNDSIYSPP